MSSTIRKMPQEHVENTKNRIFIALSLLKEHAIFKKPQFRTKI